MTCQVIRFGTWYCMQHPFTRADIDAFQAVMAVANAKELGPRGIAKLLRNEGFRVAGCPKPDPSLDRYADLGPDDDPFACLHDEGEGGGAA